MISRAVLFDAFVGRREELAFLRDARERSITDGRGSTVLVIGESGVGKTRLISEFSVRENATAGRFVRVACHEIVSAPLSPFLDALHELRTVRDPVLRKAVLAARSALENESAVVVDNAGEQRRQRRAALVEALTIAATTLGHVTLVIEDAHWMDATSLDILRDIAEVTRRRSLLLVLTARAENLDRDIARSAAFARLGADRITLGGLGPGDLLEPLQALLPAAPRAVVRRIWDLSGGKPYVAEELARSVIEHGGLSLDQVPMTLRGAVLERFGRLPERAREILRRASVFGLTFAIDDLLLLQEREEDILAALREARDLQLIAEKNEVFEFRHALTRETLYRDLLSAERSTMHREIADAIERSAPNGRFGEIAHHLWASGDAARARAASLAAGERARSIGAFADAAEHFLRVSESTDDPAEIASTATLAVEALQPLGRVDDILALCESASRALAGAERWTDVFDLRLQELKVLIFTSRVSDMKIAVDRIQALVTERAISDDRRFEAVCACADYELIALGYDAAAAHIDRARSMIAERTYAQENRLLALRGNYFRLTHRYDASDQVFRELRDRARAANDERLLAQTLGNLGFVAEARGALREGVDFCEASVAIFLRIGFNASATSIRAEGALLAAMTGDFAYVRSALDSARRAGADLSHAIWTVVRLKLVRACGGDRSEFAGYVAQPEGVQLYILAMILWELPWIDADRIEEVRNLFDRRRELVGDAADGECPFLYAVVSLGSDVQLAAIDDEIGRAQNANDRLSLAWSALLRAGLHVRRGNVSLARVEAEDAVVRFRALEMPIELAHALRIAGRDEEACGVLRACGAFAELDRFRTARLDDFDRDVALSPREREIARLTLEGLTTSAVAARLRISARTVETHLRNIFKKTGVKKRVELLDRLRK